MHTIMLTRDGPSLDYPVCDHITLFLYCVLVISCCENVTLMLIVSVVSTGSFRIAVLILAIH